MARPVTDVVVSVLSTEKPLNPASSKTLQYRFRSASVQGAANG